MKKLVVAVVVLMVIAGGVAWAMMSTPERTVCARIGELCGAEGDLADLEECAKDVEEIEKVLGKEPVVRVAACVEDAKTCAEAMGCIAGESMNSVEEQLGEFLKGVRRGMDQKK
jgi:hypothetical protein